MAQSMIQRLERERDTNGKFRGIRFSDDNRSEYGNVYATSGSVSRRCQLGYDLGLRFIV